MIKPRPCIIVSPRFRARHGLSTVVPLSTTPPTKIEPWHYLLKLDIPLPPPFSSIEMWAKCDMISAVAFERLSLIRLGKDQHGKRKYLTQVIDKADLAAIQKCVLSSLGLFN